MATERFHRFLDLPWELRHQIWGCAVHPIGHGIHTFSIVHDRETKYKNTARPPKALPSYSSCLPEYFAIVSAIEDTGKPNKSAYLWDAGLWTACKESREVIMTQLNMAHWYEKRRELVRAFWGRIPGFAGMARHPDLAAITIAPSIQDGGEDWHLLVRPGQDAIRFTPKTLLEGKYEFRWLTCIFDLPFSSVLQGCDLIRHIVLDFDSNWCRNYESLDFSGHEYAPTQFLCGILADISYSSADPAVWLIDRGTYRDDPYFKLRNGDPMVFYDCEDEYVEIEYVNPRTEERTAAHFVYTFGRIRHRAPYRSYDNYFYVQDYIKILRPKKLADALQERTAPPVNKVS